MAGYLGWRKITDRKSEARGDQKPEIGRKPE
jgi:hypothetical protein